MSTNRVTTTAALLAALAMAPLPAHAQDGQAVERRQGSARGDQSRGERRKPRDDGGGNRGSARAEGNRDNGNGNSARAEGNRDNGGNRGAEPRQAVPRAERRDEGRRDNDRRDNDRRDYDRRDNDRGYRDYRDRDRDWNRGPRYVPRPNYNRYSRPPRVYVVPYGYRPRNYRPGWSLNLYFGRPYGGYYDRYPGYYGEGYGYFDIPSNFSYGSVRIVDAPRDARVFVDGYYAGVVDDYDGVFQRLNLEPGNHYIELDVYAGAQPLEFDVYVEPGRTLTIHARP